MGGLFLICTADGDGVLQDLAVGRSDDFGHDLNDENLPATLAECGVTTPLPLVQLGILRTGPADRERFLADIEAAV